MAATPMREPDDAEPLAVHAALVAALCAVDPVGCGGVRLRAAAGPVRDAWLARWRALLPNGLPWQRVPLHIDDERLLGGLDLSASLHAGRPVAQRGVLAAADGGIVVLGMAERLGADTAARIAAAMDTAQVAIVRDGIAALHPARFATLALDEGRADDEGAPAALCDRLAFHLELPVRLAHDAADLDEQRAAVRDARIRLPDMVADDACVQALCAAALAFGVDSLRAPLLALRVARAAAALEAAECVEPRHVELAAALVLAPRATRWPAPQPPADPPAEAASSPPPPPDASTDDAQDPDAPLPDGALDERVLDAVRAALPAGLLAALQAGLMPARQTMAAAGRSGLPQASRHRGRPIGARRALPHGGARLDLLATLRAAVPWQHVRQREHREIAAAAAPRVRVAREDFHVRRYRQHRETTTIFAVDASGSSALHRLAEAKGAVERLLADCYVRRDRVAVIAFRGQHAELLLPPTRSLVRAKRSLAGLPGGGGTPLAAGIAAAMALADAERRRGASPLVVLLTDGRANVARDGQGGRLRAAEEALAAARALQAAGLAALLLDTAPQPQDAARAIAQAMGARYVPLPHADAGAMSTVVRAATLAPPAAR